MPSICYANTVGQVFHNACLSMFDFSTENQMQWVLCIPCDNYLFSANSTGLQWKCNNSFKSFISSVIYQKALELQNAFLCIGT